MAASRARRTASLQMEVARFTVGPVIHISSSLVFEGSLVAALFAAVFTALFAGQFPTCRHSPGAVQHDQGLPSASENGAADNFQEYLVDLPARSGVDFLVLRGSVDGDGVMTFEIPDAENITADQARERRGTCDTVMSHESLCACVF